MSNKINESFKKIDKDTIEISVTEKRVKTKEELEKTRADLLEGVARIDEMLLVLE